MEESGRCWRCQSVNAGFKHIWWDCVYVKKKLDNDNETNPVNGERKIGIEPTFAFLSNTVIDKAGKKKKTFQVDYLFHNRSPYGVSCILGKDQDAYIYGMDQ